MAKCIFGQTVFTGVDPPVLNPDTIKFAQEYGWAIMLSLPGADAELYFTDTDYATHYAGVIQSIIDEGLKVWLVVQAITYYGTTTKETTVLQYESAYNDCLAIYETLGDSFLGYAFEGGFDNAILWLDANIGATRKINHQLFANYWYLYGDAVAIPQWGGMTNAQRFAYFDEITWIVYEQLDALRGVSAPFGASHTPIKTWLNTNIPTMQFSIISGRQVNDNDSGQWFWNYDTHAHGYGRWIPPIEQKELFTRYLLDFKDGIGVPFDTIVCDATMYGITETVADQCIYMDSLALDVPGTKKAWATMSQGGAAPYYNGASSCGITYPIPIDSFINTGNEIILLKNYDVAAEHDITVTSSLDPLIHEDYTVSLSPDRGTFIGPYPLDDYGALPTITYDNTNLYVSVLNVEPTA